MFQPGCDKLCLKDDEGGGWGGGGGEWGGEVGWKRCIAGISVGATGVA